MEGIMPEAFCYINVAENVDCALYWLDQIIGMLESIGEEGRSEVVKRMMELRGVDMSGYEKPNVGEFYLVSLLAIKKRLSESLPPER